MREHDNMIITNQKELPETEKTTPDEERLFTSLRADSWSQFYGADLVKKNLRVAIAAAKKRKEALEHVLLYGPPGLGKTTLSHLIAKEMEVNIRVTSGPALERTGDIASILTNLEPKDILFIDEIHRLNKVVEEMLYPAMEDFALDIVVGKGPSARTLRLDLPPFTIVGATTRAGLLSSPLRDRFGIVNRLSYYDPPEIEKIIEHAATKLNVVISSSAKKQLAKRSRGTPRIALRLLKRVRDVAQIEGKNIISDEILQASLTLLQVDEQGLDAFDQKLIITVIEKFNGGPVGLTTLAAALSEDIGTVEEIMEPYLMQIGFIKRTARGRIITSAGFAHFNKTVPSHLQDLSLF